MIRRTFKHPMRAARTLWVESWILGLLLCLVGCSYPAPDYSDWDMTQEVRDSLQFLAGHHYTTNYNFEVTVDSLKLNQKMEDGNDSLYVYAGDELVVADYLVAPGDSLPNVWIKVARDQRTMGWIPEARLLESIVPIDPISKFIHLFSNIHIVVFIIVVGLFMGIFLYRRMERKKFDFTNYRQIKSIYPILLCMLVACSATFYASIQLFVPETWEHYYYNPTLNPFELPFILACFIASVWAILLVALALVDDLFHQTDFPTLFYYLLGMATACLFFYLFFTLTTMFYVGYPCLLLFLVYGIRMLTRMKRRYICGNCGGEMTEKGICPHCGAFNE